jgi:hypothetical protein
MMNHKKDEDQKERQSEPKTNYEKKNHPAIALIQVAPHEAARQAVYSGVAPQPAPRGL